MRDLVFNIWNYRTLVKKTALSDLKLRYRNSVLGFFWSLLEPLLIFIVLYVVFSYLMRFQIAHYQLFLLLGIIIWRFLEEGTTMSMNSIVGKPSLIKKVYFPRESLIVSACLTALIMSILELLVFGVFMLFSGVMPTINAVAFPAIFLFQFLLITGLSLALASLNVYYRDVQYIWAVVLRAGFFATPIIYPASLYPEEYAWVFMLNPMARLVEAARGSLIYGSFPSLLDTAYIFAGGVALVLIGYAIFTRLEPKFAEEV